MIDVATLPPVAQAGALIGAVLLEAIVLYVVYGLAGQAVGQQIVNRVKKN